MMDETTKKALDLICEIREQLGSDYESDVSFLLYATMDALEDGEFLNSYFNGVDNESNKAVVEKAYDMISKRLDFANKEWM